MICGARSSFANKQAEEVFSSTFLPAPGRRDAWRRSQGGPSDTHRWVPTERRGPEGSRDGPTLVSARRCCLVTAGAGLPEPGALHALPLGARRGAADRIPPTVPRVHVVRVPALPGASSRSPLPSRAQPGPREPPTHPCPRPACTKTGSPAPCRSPYLVIAYFI